MRRHVLVDGGDDRVARQHGVERAFEPDDPVATQDAAKMGEVGVGAQDAKTDGVEQLLGFGGRPIDGREASFAEHDHARAMRDERLRPKIELGRLHAIEPGDDAADLRGALGGRRSVGDIPVVDDETEIVERHFDKAMNARDVGLRLLAAIENRENFPPDGLWFGRRMLR